MPSAILLYGGAITPIKLCEKSVEPYLLGAINKDSVEPFDLVRANVAITSNEPFDLKGNIVKSSVEPYDLGGNLRFDSVEVFSLNDATTGYLGTNSPASPRMGWRDR